ncbi:hypothetical protein D4F06_24180 [Salmonella enterica subsp. enterica serovar Muenchen]|nr:hypothetical protein [Salmonella enterica subsp. enterica serovar Muenchen]ECJ4482594.1 hypothetical protein [Salmonella enterica subsp. diarizonae]EJR0737599.1 hypothetical protein [Salmonella enterica]EBY3557360.1 hypothetical protein [Salmonella enterica subsp. enterica serovar Muenchen]ECZ0255756.1 hypothetical protein [Salmonella enterica subsp. diarizonae]
MVAEKALGAQHTIHYPNATKKFRKNKQQNGSNRFWHQNHYDHFSYSPATQQGYFLNSSFSFIPEGILGATCWLFFVLVESLNKIIF